MRAILLPHADTPCRAIDRIDVEIDRLGPDRWRLRYTASGRIADLRLPAPSPPARADGLWKHTCFEVFVRQPGADTYREYNFSPSTQWAAYGFERYRREGALDLQCPSPPIETQASAGVFQLSAEFDLPELNTPWRLALSAVIEEISGAKSFWALAHPPGEPDFHHPDGFALEIGALEGSVLDRVQDLKGVCQGPEDLSSNPKHLCGYGK